MTHSQSPMLELEDVQTAYGQSQVLFGMTLRILPGEVVTLMGRNGMGKTTTVRSILGLTPAHSGSIRFAGEEIRDLPSFKIAKMGIGLAPEGRQIFPNLSVRENLLATARATPWGRGWNLERTLEFFPRLRERLHSRGDQLSGGEQQMLSLGRALMTNPRLLILDEATEGLAPLIREEIWHVLESLKAEGESILVIDKNVDVLKHIADRHFIMEKGQLAWQGTSAELMADQSVLHRYLGV